MKRVFLHIGTHKTGTTAIQKFLASAEGRLREDGVLYPRSGRPAEDHGAQYGHHLLSWAIRKKKGVDHYNDWKEVIGEIDAAKEQIAVLSSEDFETCTDGQIARIAALLKDFDVHVVLYLRNPIGFTVSAYKQFVKGGKTSIPFNKFIHEWNWTQRCDYSHLVQKWAEKFGVSSVHVILFDKFKITRSVEFSFLQLLGLDENYYRTYITAPANVSPSDEQIVLVRQINSLEKIIGRRSSLQRIRRSVLQERSVGLMLLKLTSPLLRFGSYDAGEMRRLGQKANERNHALLGSFISESDWKYIRC